ncbi:hypothetical protein [Parasitella parasitica]|uniref:DUF6987 domain-containing protein n=1 Tax=Parasitella parasitica TaxID=35722 RepID=A0A0B7NW44_9FUNG|nr:hypothetical protein [Parasitella parasitica]
MKNQQAKQQEAAAAAAARAAEDQNQTANEQPDQGQETQESQEPQNENQEQTQDRQEPNQDQSDNNKDQDSEQEQQEQGVSENEEESDEEEDSDEEDDDDELEELYRLMVGKRVNKSGLVVDKKSGTVLGKIAEGKLKRMSGKKVRDNGEVYNDKGKLIGRVEPVQEDSDDSEENDGSEEEESAANEGQEDVADTIDNNSAAPGNDVNLAADENESDSNDKVDDAHDAANDLENNAEDKADEVQDSNQDLKDNAEKKAGDAQEATNDMGNDAQDEAEDAKDETEDTASDAENTAENTQDREVNQDDESSVENAPDGDNKDNAEENEEDEDEDKPFNPYDLVDENSPEVRKSGKVVDTEDNVIGTVNKSMAPKLAGFKVDKDGNVINHEGHIVAKADLYQPLAEKEEDKPYNPNENVTEDSPEVRKSGKIVDMEDNIVGAIDKEQAAKFAGFKVDPQGNVIDPEGHIVARADLYPIEEDDDGEEKPFNPNEMVNADSPEVRKSGKVLDMDDNLVGYVDKRVASKLAGMKVDEDGNVINDQGHIVGKANMLKPEPEPEEEEPKKEEKKPFNPNENVNEDSPEVKKSGKILDMDDELVGHIDKKLAAKFAGFKVDPQGNVIDNDGHIVATAEMIKVEEEKKPFNPNEAVDENSPEVKRSGKVVDMDDNIVGSVDKRLAPKLAGFKVDDNGNVIDNEGHIVARAEMIPQEEESDPNKPFNPNTMVDEHSPRVRKSGKVVDEDDNIVGEVEKSSAHKLAGFPVDDDGNIIDNEGHIVGKAKMHDKKTEEQLKEEAEQEEYRKIADQMSQSIQISLDKIKPILKNITDVIDEEEAKPQKERDEQKLVDTVKPLIEQGSAILEECNGAVRGLDPSGRIAKQAQAKTSARQASPEEYHLADLLAQLSGDISTTIDRAKKKVRSMPHAKKELSPLWNILQSPLLQILSAVGLLLTGVLGLVGNILNGLGLGSIINSLLGGIGLNKILEGFGLGDALNLGRKK